MEEENSKPRATEADIDHTDLVQAQKDKNRTAAIEKIIQDGRADAVERDAALSPPTPVKSREMVGSSGRSCSAHIRNSRVKALRNTGADRATPTSQGSDGSHRVDTCYDVF